MSIPITIRLCLFTPTGPAGSRLERGVPLPLKSFDFPDTEEGRRQADEAREALQNYVTRYIIPKAAKQ